MPEEQPLNFLAADDDDGDIIASRIELEKIPRRLWEQTLAPLHYQERYEVARRISDEELRGAGLELAYEMDSADVARRRERLEAQGQARRAGAPLPTPDADHATARSSPQLNFRLRHDDHARLKEAAAAAGMRPTTLARALVLNGVAMILRERDAGRDPSRGSPPNRGLSFRE